MSGSHNSDLYYRITDLPAAGNITGKEIVEAIQNGVNVKFTLAQLLVAGKSAYDIAIEEGFIGSEVDWLLSLKGDTGLDGQNGAAGQNGKSAYEIAVAHGFMGTEAEFAVAMTSKPTKSGAVFVTAVTPQNAEHNVGDVVYTDDGAAVINCSSTTKEVTIKVLAMTGFSRFRPRVTVNNLPVELTAKADAPLFEGAINITLDNTGIVSVKHEDGPEWIIRVRMDKPPVITSASFNGGYPVGQTELKAGDKFSIIFSADVPVSAYEIENSGAFVASSGSFTAGTSAVIKDLVIANRGNETQDLGFRLRVKKPSGAWSDWFDSTAAVNINGVNTVKLNNQFPVITFSDVVYPEGQAALKDNEIATVNHTVTHYDDIQYTASADLTVVGPTTYAADKKVMRTAGTYNTSVKNFTVKATRLANGAVSEGSVVVAIAQAAPTITVTTPATRLRSGGNAGTAVQNHVITISSDQALAEPPTLNAPEGAWAGVAFVPNAAKTVWTRTLRVHDDNAKGTFSWNSLSAKNMAGVVQDKIDQGGEYALGGFVFRILTVPAFPVRSVAIGTDVANTGKLRSTNLSKGGSGSLNVTYQADKTEAVNRYTIINEAGNADAAGSVWYNADGANASSNTGGTMKIEIEEVV